MDVLLVAADPATLDVMRLTVRSLERRLGGPIRFLEAPDGVRGLEVALRERPDAVVADEITSPAGAFGLARDLRGQADPYPGAIVILLDRRQDEWLARWSGADAWFVKPVDPFALADRLVGLVTEEESA
ncbi:MAG: hypothetical protein ACKO8G_07170 [Actinomycetota bacterium]